MDFFRAHLLSIVTLPACGALALLLPAFKKNDDLTRWVANAFGVLGFLVSLPSGSGSTGPSHAFQFVEKGLLDPSIGVQYHFGVDGISVLLICSPPCWVDRHPLLWTAITTGCASSTCPAAAPDRDAGVFCALDMFLFYLFWR